MFVLLICFVSGVFFGDSVVFGKKTDFFDLSRKEFLEEGTFKDVFLKEETFLTLTPTTKVFSKIDSPVIWSSLKTKDTLFVGTGHEGYVYLLDNNGKLKTKIQVSGALEITSFAASDKEEIFVATAPDGGIYKLDASKQKIFPFVVLPEKFIWSITAYKEKLYVACGGGKKGTLYEVDVATRKWSKIYESTENNILKVKVRDEKIYFSTSGEGYLYCRTKDKKVRLLYDAGGRDINDFVFHKKNIYVGTSGEPDALENKEKKLSKSRNYKNNIVVIDENNALKVLLWADNYLIPALSVDPETQTLYAALISLDENEKESAIYSADLNTFEVSRSFLLKDATFSGFSSLKNRIFFSSGESGEIYELVLSYPQEGIYTSEVLDANETVDWGNVDYKWYQSKTDENVGAKNIQKNMKISVRTGNSFSTKIPDAWSDGTPLEEGKITSRPSRFIQMKVHLKPIESKNSPMLSDIKIYYARGNQRPEILNAYLAGHLQANIRSQKNYKNGFQQKLPKLKSNELLLFWQTYNDDDDDLFYSIYYLIERQGAEWKLLSENQRRRFFVLDKTKFIDGEYRFKIVVDDILSNGPENRLKSKKITKKYVIDNTHPLVSYTIEGDQLMVKVKDSFSRIKKCMFSVNRENYYGMTPKDGVFDEKQETFELKNPEFKNGIVLYIEDESENYVYKTIETPEK